MPTRKMGRSLKSQAFYGDFIISVFILIVVILVYFEYIKNLPDQDSKPINDLLAEADIITSSLISQGYPLNWDANNVVRAGFADSGNKINNARFAEFVAINYNKSKKLLGVTNDYFLYFQNGSGNVKNVEGFCGTGFGEVNISYDIKAAYYYENMEQEQFMKSFMESEFDATVYCDGSKKCDYLPFSQLLNDIGSYDFIVVEHPYWSTSKFNDFEDAADPWLQNGGILFVGGEMPTQQGTEAFGVEFYKKSGQSQSDRLSTVVKEDEYTAFSLADNIVFRQAYYIEDVSVGPNLKDIARFNGTDIEFNDILDNDIALARWPYGSGKVFFFSDFDATYLAGNFKEVLEGAAKKWANAKCLPIDISKVKRQDLVRSDRLLIYNNQIVKMVLYVWQ